MVDGVEIDKGQIGVVSRGHSNERRTLGWLDRDRHGVVAVQYIGHHRKNGERIPSVYELYVVHKR